MKLAPSKMADTVIVWYERFELNELEHEKQRSLIDDVLMEISRRVDQARRREEWDTALRDGQLALEWAIEWPTRINKNDAAAEQTALYSEAVVRLYAGVLGLARNDVRAALGHFRLSARMFGNLERQRAESIAQAATGIACEGCGRWTDALEAYQRSIGLIDRMETLNSSLKELRRQIMQTVPVTLDCYEAQASPGTQ